MNVNTTTVTTTTSSSSTSKTKFSRPHSHHNHSNHRRPLPSLPPPPKQKPKLNSSKPPLSFSIEDEDSDFEDNGFNYAFPLSPSSPSSSSSSSSSPQSLLSSSPSPPLVAALSDEATSGNSTPRKTNKKGSLTTEKPPETPLKKERALVEELFVEGSYKYRTRQDYYAVERSWWDHWACHANYLGRCSGGPQRASFGQRLLSAEPPGPINNLALVELNTTLVAAYESFGGLIGAAERPSAEVLGEFPPNVSQAHGYVCVPAGVWTLLHRAYGGGPEVRVQHAGPIIGECCRFELLELVVVHSRFPGRVFPVECYNYWTAGHLKRVLMTVFRCCADEGAVRLVDLSCRAQRTVLRDDMTLVLNKIVSANCILFEVKDEATGEWPNSLGPEKCSKKNVEQHEREEETKEEKNEKNGNGTKTTTTMTVTTIIEDGMGLCGLENMGNTCYMNCVLQALAHTVPLTRYLLGTDWRHDPRIRGPGRIVNEYCALLEGLLGGRRGGGGGPLEPRAFRSRLVALVPHFSGLQQQDCHEMLNALLDALGEDLNCAPAAPAGSAGGSVAAPEYSGERAEEWARAAWERHTGRRWSVVDALFSGQLLGTRECPDCGARTLSCQPFQTLELPIPAGPARRRQVVRVCLSASERLRRLGLHLTLSFAVDAGCTVAGLRRRTAEVLNAIGGPLSGNSSGGSGGGEEFDEGRVLLAHIAQGRAVLDADPAAPVCSHSEYVACVTDAPADLETHRLIQVRMCEARAGGPLSPVNTCFLYLPAGSVSYARVAVEVVRVFAGLSTQKHAEAERKLSELAEFRVAAAAKRRSPQSSPAQKGPQPRIGTRSPSVSDGGADNGIGGSSNNKGNESDGSDLGSPVFERVSNRAVAECAASLFELQEFGSWQGRGGRRRWREHGAGEPGPAGVVTLNAVVTAKWRPLCAPRPEECAQYNEGGDGGGDGGGGCGGCALSLDDCLAAVTRPEQLSEGNGWRCPRCAAEKKAVVTLRVWRAPPVLVVDLLRFSVQSQYASSKVETRVAFPVSGLDLGPYVSGPPPREGLCYDLYAVCNHVGSLTCGHYTASVKCGDAWYLFDDAVVKRIDDPETAVVTQDAYLLFYLRRGVDCGSLTAADAFSAIKKDC